MANVELIKQFYHAFKNKDKETYLGLCDENITWQLSEGMPNGGVYVGKDAVFKEYFPKMLSNFKEFHAIPEQFTDMKDHVMVNGMYSGISNTGKSFEVAFSHVYHIQDDKIIQFRQFTDTQKIQESLK
ncbi:putative ketosteroid isomeraserelated protein-like protein [Candidatus Nitrosopumilus koreensis AR1]|uniref:Putative ketosteroid isomeraserelated protein-like protein n=1 Tax=Candidatus Nitrosopumilus koreensis AR1 TaxID=1229908 RepID=K0B6B9_9ARCH|nr:MULTISPECIES: nuclear transport factor 2 family protein [Nitrosopumilus]AFS80687.1 putative ketosteroid isomeraserelated protein-like protein [Candidatus Nitrosopumilus koreensis AR1]